MTHLLIVFGTRPEAIKMAPLIKHLRADAGFRLTIGVTAQHRQMLDPILDWFQITPDVDLDLMQPDQTLADLTALALQGVSRLIEQVQPDLVLVQGDTTTAMAAAMAAFYRQVPIGHLEAGLRTYNLGNPFPEEANRRLISVMAVLHFAPTITARDALLREQIDPLRVYLTGNTVIDALQWTVQQPFELRLEPYWQRGRLILVTAHRRESFGADFEQICHALRQIAARNPDVQIVYPVHLNPHVQEPVYRLLGGLERVHLIAPLPYPDFVHLLAHAELVITDSGGLQEEAPALGKPVLVLRRATERPEAIASGAARLVGTEAATIIAETERLLRDPAAYAAMASAVNPFGDGHAAEKITAILKSYRP